VSFGSKTSSGGLTISVNAETTSLANPITWYKSKTGKYPSNAEIWWSMKRPPELGADAPPKLYLEVFDPGLRHQVFFGGTPAPKGHYILSAFHKDRGAASDISGITVETTQAARPRATAFWAGRVFWAGVESAGWNTHVYFSQILERAEQAGDCFQTYDPTSETLRDLLPSDGGDIIIPEVALVYHMQPFGNSLMVFANNGVWRISGSEGTGFRANDYSVTKLAGTPTISSLSFVDVEGVPMWWNRSSINMISQSETGSVGVQSITDETIKRLFQEIPEQSKLYAKGAYNPLTKEVQYLYRSEATEVQEDLFKYDRLLIFDVRTAAFVPWSVEHDNVEIQGIFALSGQAVSQVSEDVTVGGVDVTVSSVVVTVLLEQRAMVESRIKYIVNVIDDLETPPAAILI
jgi:hypothetical protein